MKIFLKKLKLIPWLAIIDITTVQEIIIPIVGFDRKANVNKNPINIKRNGVFLSFI